MEVKTSSAPSILNWVSNHKDAPANLIAKIVDWFVLNRNADYGLAVMRMASGTLILGWLLQNIPVANRIWGPGSAYWDPYRAVLGYKWPLDILREAGTGFFWGWYAVAILLAIAFIFGWRTRVITPLFFVFYTAINAQNTPIADGGNYFIRIMLIYMIFADISRRWSLDARRRSLRGNNSETQIGTVLHNLALCLIVAQLCLVYFEAGMYKVQGSLWQSGEAMYYPISSKAYGIFPWLSELLTANTWMVVLLTYFTVVVQIAFPFLLFNRVTRRIALISILGMHVGIAVVMGLPFFSGIMASADAVLVSAATWVTIATWLGIQFRGIGRRVPIVNKWIRPEPESSEEQVLVPERPEDHDSPKKDPALV
ncbi:HTTM domain-containing protein [Paeniglutamicibacter sp. NPDC091659]|uniref:HTTM domain-containing protein n=1 Tax=Paeniglutamicibacter sp. NPDC091659 TaxID=3364389 RepID=UPI0038102E8E